MAKIRLNPQDKTMFLFCCFVGAMFLLLAYEYGSTVVPPRTDEDPAYKPSPEYTFGFGQATPLATAIGSWYGWGLYCMHRSKAVDAIRRRVRLMVS